MAKTLNTSKVALLAGGLAVLTLLLLAYLLALDEPPPDVSDLTAPPDNLAVPGELDFLGGMEALLPFFKEDADDGVVTPWEEYGDVVGLFLADETYDEAALARLLEEADAAQVWRKLETALGAPGRRRYWGADIATGRGSIIETINVSRLIVVKVRRAVAEADWTGAERHFRQAVLFAAKTEQSANGVTLLMTGLACRAHAQEEARRLLEKGRPPALLARSFGEILAEFPLEPLNIREAIRGEFCMADATLRNLVYAPAKRQEKWFGSRYYFNVVLKPNASVALMAGPAREALRMIDSTTEAEWQVARGTMRKWEELEEGPRWFDPRNKLGRMTVGLLSSSGILDSICDNVFQRRAEDAVLRAALAAYAHAREKGHLPESLAALVPEYLPAVPLDTYDGQPVRYSRAERKVWSGKTKATDGEESEGARVITLPPAPFL